MKLFVAPIQGHTDAAFRHFHAAIYGSATEYTTPFVRIEHGEPRLHDLRDIKSPLNENLTVRPQIIFKNPDEFRLLVNTIKDSGYQKVDLNLGCPFPPQIHKGRGSAMISNIDCMQVIADLISADRDMDYSVKMRLGVNDNREWEPIVRLFNEVPLSRITIHPRIAKQQYKGTVDMEQFRRILDMTKHPVVYNGDIISPQDITRIADVYPSIEGIMIGRGLLRRPSLIAEWEERAEWSQVHRIETLLDFHNRLLDYYSTTLCGEAQILSHIKTVWEYSEGEVSHKALKLIKKSTSLHTYRNAISMITD